MKMIIAGLAVTVLAGCATPSADIARMHYDAQSRAADRPLVQMVALPGESIELKGVAQFSVYAPTGGNGGVTQYREAHHPAWGLLGDALRIGAPIYLGGQAAIGLADVVGRRVGDVALSPTVVNQPSPIVVEQPPYNDPVVVTQPEPVIVQQPPYNDPIIVEPVIVETVAPAP